MKKSMKIVSAGMTLLFIAWAYYQYNDPDPFVWILVYGVAALTSVLFLIQRLPLAFTMGYFVVCAAWALYTSTQVTYGPPLIQIEEWREMMGLVIVCIWMGVLSWWLYKARTTRNDGALH